MDEKKKLKNILELEVSKSFIPKITGVDRSMLYNFLNKKKLI